MIIHNVLSYVCSTNEIETKADVTVISSVTVLANKCGELSRLMSSNTATFIDIVILCFLFSVLTIQNILAKN